MYYTTDGSPCSPTATCRRTPRSCTPRRSRSPRRPVREVRRVRPRRQLQPGRPAASRRRPQADPRSPAPLRALDGGRGAADAEAGPPATATSPATACSCIDNMTGQPAGGPRDGATRSPDHQRTSTAGTSYSFTVQAKNGERLRRRVGSVRRAHPERPHRPRHDRTAKWKAGDFRVTGTGSSVGATVTIRERLGDRSGPRQRPGHGRRSARHRRRVRPAVPRTGRRPATGPPRSTWCAAWAASPGPSQSPRGRASAQQVTYPGPVAHATGPEA